MASSVSKLCTPVGYHIMRRRCPSRNSWKCARTMAQMTVRLLKRTNERLAVRIKDRLLVRISDSQLVRMSSDDWSRSILTTFTVDGQTQYLVQILTSQQNLLFIKDDESTEPLLLIPIVREVLISQKRIRALMKKAWVNARYHIFTYLCNKFKKLFFQKCVVVTSNAVCWILMCRKGLSRQMRTYARRPACLSARK